MKPMSWRIIIHWCAILIVYLTFLIWHGAFERHLTDDEIQYYASLLSEQNPEIDQLDIEKALKNDPGRPIYMVNVVKLRDRPLAIQDGAFQGQTSQQLYEHYGAFVGSFLLKHGSYPVFVGLAEGDAVSSWGMDSDTEWTSAAIVRYRSLRTLLELATHPEFIKKHEFKFAAIEKTLAYPTMARLNFARLDLIVFLILVMISYVLLIANRLGNARKSNG